MPTPQSAIIPEPRPAALFLILKVRTPKRAAKSVLADIVQRCGQLSKEMKAAHFVTSVGIGPALWKMLSPKSAPRHLHPFRAVTSGRRSAPATHGDVLIHVLSDRHDLNMHFALDLMAALGARVSVMDEVHGFKYLDGRDLTGFIDGTENPDAQDERREAALIGDDDAAFAGGSYVFTQRYVHNLAKWRQAPLGEQEGTIGRRKTDSEEIPPEKRPAHAHISRVVIEEHGEELEIVRHSFPYGTTREAGLFFIAYTRDLAIPEKMLARMMGTSGDRQHDHLMDFTRAVSGAYFFAPSQELLRRLCK